MANDPRLDETNLRTGKVVRYSQQYGCGFLKVGRFDGTVCFLWEGGRSLSANQELNWAPMPPGKKILQPKLGDILVFTLVYQPVPHAGCWTYADYYEVTRKALSQRQHVPPIYRLVRLYQIAGTLHCSEPVWTGQDLRDPKLAQAWAKHQQLSQAGNPSTMRFEIWHPDGQWLPCPDPRQAS